MSSSPEASKINETHPIQFSIYSLPTELSKEDRAGAVEYLPFQHPSWAPEALSALLFFSAYPLLKSNQAFEMKFFPKPNGLESDYKYQVSGGLIFIWMLIVLLFIYLFKCSGPSIITSVKWVIKGRKFEVEGSICKLLAKPAHLHTLYTT